MVIACLIAKCCDNDRRRNRNYEYLGPGIEPIYTGGGGVGGTYRGGGGHTSYKPSAPYKPPYQPSIPHHGHRDSD